MDASLAELDASLARVDAYLDEVDVRADEIGRSLVEVGARLDAVGWDRAEVVMYSGDGADSLAEGEGRRKTDNESSGHWYG